MRIFLQKVWDFLTYPLTRLSGILKKWDKYPFETVEESNRFLGFLFVSLAMTYVVYFTSNSDLAWAIFLGGGQVYAFLHELLNCLLYEKEYRINLGFLGILGIVLGVFAAFLSYMVIFGFGGAIINLFR